MIQQLTIENQTTTERYLKTIEKTKTLESQIEMEKTTFKNQTRTRHH